MNIKQQTIKLRIQRSFIEHPYRKCVGWWAYQNMKFQPDYANEKKRFATFYSLYSALTIDSEKWLHSCGYTATKK